MWAINSECVCAQALLLNHCSCLVDDSLLNLWVKSSDYPSFASIGVHLKRPSTAAAVIFILFFLLILNVLVQLSIHGPDLS